MSKFTITYSETLPKGEKFGGFNKLEVAQEFDTKDTTLAAAVELVKATVTRGLGKFDEAEAHMQRVFVELRHRDEDFRVAIDRMHLNDDDSAARVISYGTQLVDQARFMLVDAGFDIDEVYAAQARAEKVVQP